MPHRWPKAHCEPRKLVPLHHKRPADAASGSYFDLGKRWHLFTPARRLPLPALPPSPVLGQETASLHQQVPSPSRGPSLPRPGERVEAVLLEEKTKKGGWRARHLAAGIADPILNSNNVPSDRKADDTVTLFVQSANERKIAFCYQTVGDEQKPKQPGGKRPSRGR